ncbi:MAG: hypothetical protein AAF196_19985 [Planctomycetota bacterium]
MCHLLTRTTENGVDNTTSSALLLSATTLLVGGTLLPLWWHAATEPCMARACRGLGILSTALVVTLCVELFFDLPLPHGALALGAGAAGLFPTAIFGLSDWRRSDRIHLRHFLAVFALLSGAVNLVGYVLVELGQPLTMIVPTAQNLAFASLLGWLALVDTAPRAMS